jgi:hypothetical protein
MTLTELLPPEILGSADGYGTTPETLDCERGVTQPVCRCTLAAFGRCPTQSGSVGPASHGATSPPMR